MIKQVELVKKYSHITSGLKALLLEANGEKVNPEVDANSLDFARDSLKKLIAAKSEFELASSGIGEISEDKAIANLNRVMDEIARSMQEISFIRVSHRIVGDLSDNVKKLATVDAEIEKVVEKLISSEKSITKRTVEEIASMLSGKGMPDAEKLKKEIERVESELSAKNKLLSILVKIKESFAECDEEQEEHNANKDSAEKAFSQINEILNAMGFKIASPEETRNQFEEMLKNIDKLGILFGQSNKSDDNKASVGTLKGSVSRSMPFLTMPTKEDIAELLRHASELERIFHRK